MTACLRDFDVLLARARSEYLEMPGLAITLQQASRLWNTEPEITRELLTRLVTTRFLRERENGSFVRAGDGLPQSAMTAGAPTA